MGVDSNGCVGMDMITLWIDSLPTVTASASATTVCEGSPVTFTGSGASTYTWNGGVTDNVPFNVTSTMTYIVTGTDANGCMNNDSITVMVNMAPTVIANLPSSICLDDADMTLVGAPAGGTWSGTGVIGSSFDPSVPGVGTTVITYSYTDSLGCTGMGSDSVVVDPCTGIATPNAVSGISIYPNPNAGQFTIQLSEIPANVVTVEILDALGQTVQAFTIIGATKQVDLGIYDSGVYFVRVTNGTNVSVHRVVTQ
jgi:hypothetical protein